MKKIISNKIYFFIAFIFLSFSIGFILGAYEYKKGHVSHYKKILFGLINQNINIVYRLINYDGENLEEKLNILISDENLIKLNTLRNLAINNGSITEEIKSYQLNAKVQNEDREYEARISLTGTNLDHLISKNQWSLRIISKKKNINEEQNKFSILVPYARGNNILSEWLNLKLTSHLEVPSINYEYIKLFINDEDKGLYAMEEHFDDFLKNYEYGSLIFKIMDDVSIKIYSGHKDEDSIYRHNINFIKIWNSFLKGEASVSQVFDIKKIATHYALSDLVNGHHTHHLANNFFLFNNKNKLIYPVGREWESPYLEKNNFDIFINSHTNFGSKETQEFHKLFFNDKEFVIQYLKILNQITEKKFLKNFVNDQKIYINKNQEILNFYYPTWDTSENYLFDNIDIIKQKIKEFDNFN